MIFLSNLTAYYVSMPKMSGTFLTLASTLLKISNLQTIQTSTQHFNPAFKNPKLLHEVSLFFYPKTNSSIQISLFLSKRFIQLFKLLKPIIIL